MEWSQRHMVIVIFFSALLARLGFYYLFLSNNPIPLAYDSGHYHTIAMQLANGLGYTKPDGAPHLYRLPGYPIFLAICYRLLSLGYQGALGVQIVLASCIPVLGFYVTRLLLPQAVIAAYVVATVLVVHPGLLIFSGLVMSETLFLLMFLLFLLLYLRLLQRSASHWYEVGGAGLLLGLASLIRPVGLPLIIALAVGLLWRWGGNRGWLMGAGLLVGWLAVVGSWLLRNVLLTGVWCLHTLTGPHLINHGAARVVAAATPCSYAQAQAVVQQQLSQQIALEQQTKGHILSESERSQVMEKFALQVLRQHPWQVLTLGVVNVTKTALSLYSSELLCIDAGGALPSYDPGRGWASAFKRFIAPEVHNRWIVLVIYIEILLHLLILLGCIGYCYQFACGRWPLLPSVLMLVLVAIFIVLSFLCGFARLRLPVELFLVIMAAAFYTASKTT